MRTLELRGLSVAYGGAAVLRDVALDTRPGEAVGIVGPNGAGKSTLLKALLGLVPAEALQLEWNGVPLASIRAQMSYMPQRSDIDWDYPILARQVVEMGRWRSGFWRRRTRADRAVVDAALNRLEVAALADRQIGELSGGQRQRVLLARTLARDAAILLLDEPFAAVDARTGELLWAELERLRSEGRQLLVVHHDLPSAAARFDRVLLLGPHFSAFGAPGDVLTPQRLAAAYGGTPGASDARNDPDALRSVRRAAR